MAPPLHRTRLCVPHAVPMYTSPLKTLTPRPPSTPAAGACRRTIQARTVQNQTGNPPGISWAMDLARKPAASTQSDITGTAVLVSPRNASVTGITFNVQGGGSCVMANGSCAEPVALQAGRSVTCTFTWWVVGSEVCGRLV